jgi:3-deoxy-7-phosphoheptulonate synthase
MHGNTRTTAEGIKTRNFEEILGEVDQAFDIHAACGNRLGGIHIEVTGENVTECIGGARGVREADLKLAYKSGLDPRLNYEQALEVALFISERQKTGDRGKEDRRQKTEVRSPQ